MIRTYLQCDLCGDKWDISDTNYQKTCNYPGLAYVKDCISSGRRKYIIQKGTYTSDGRLERDDLDLCDGCYNRLDRFIFDLTKRKEN